VKPSMPLMSSIVSVMPASVACKQRFVECPH
jgi:hypothetical protein